MSGLAAGTALLCECAKIPGFTQGAARWGLYPKLWFIGVGIGTLFFQQILAPDIPVAVAGADFEVDASAFVEPAVGGVDADFDIGGDAMAYLGGGGNGRSGQAELIAV